MGRLTGSRVRSFAKAFPPPLIHVQTYERGTSKSNNGASFVFLLLPWPACLIRSCFRGLCVSYALASVACVSHTLLLPWPVCLIRSCFHGLRVSYALASVACVSHTLLLPWPVCLIRSCFRGLRVSYALRRDRACPCPPVSQSQRLLVHARGQGQALSLRFHVLQFRPAQA